MKHQRKRNSDGLTNTQRRALAFVRYIRENGPMTTHQLVERYNRWYHYTMTNYQASMILSKSGLFVNMGVEPKSKSTRWGVKP